MFDEDTYETFFFIVECHIFRYEFLWTFCPWQGVLEAMQKVYQTPTDDCVVIQCDDEAYDR